MIRTGIVGIGRIGSVHEFNIKHKVAGKLRLVAVCDIDTEKLKKYNNSKIKTYTDYKAMIDSGEVDAIIISTPHDSHCTIAKYAIAKGIHTLVEKPLAVDLLEAQKTIEFAAKYKDVTFMIMFNQRTNNLYKKAKQIIDSEKLGKLKRANWIITNWYRPQTYYDQSSWRAKWKSEGGGVLINQCVHQLDLLQWLLGMPKSVMAKCKTINRNITVENDVTAYFEYNNEASVVFITSTHDLPGTNRLEITGDCGRLIIENSHLTFDKLNRSEPEINCTPIDGKFGSYGKFKIKKKTYSYGVFKKILDKKFGQQRNVLKHFSDVIKGKAKCNVCASEGINSLILLNGIYLSGWRNKEITFPVDGNEYIKELNLHKEL